MKFRVLDYPSLNTDLATLVLRMIFGGLFFSFYGWMKLFNYKDFRPMWQDLLGIGFTFSYNLVVFAEFFCGFLVLIGLFTRMAVIPIAITMGVAYFVAHKNDPFIEKQIVFIYLFLSVVVFILGSGKYSVDRLVFGKK